MEQAADVEGRIATGDPAASKQDDAQRFSDAFFQCYSADAARAESAGGALSCVGEGARVGLESFFTRKDLHVSDGLALVREDAAQPDPAGREVPFLQDHLYDGQHRSVIDSAAAYLSARSLRWDMSGLYPGLIMRVGPTLSGSGWLEFVLEPRRAYTDRQLGPGRTVLKQVVLPFLLGLKVSVASLVPLLLFAIVFLAKKALLMSQLSALVSGLMGFGAYSQYGAYGGHPHAFGGGGDPGFGVLGGPHLGNPLVPLRTSPQVFPTNPRLPPPVEEGPNILHTGANTLPGTLSGGLGGGLGGSYGLSPTWLSGTPQHLFRKVNYDLRDERHATAASSTSAASSNSPRNTKGFRWEDEVRQDDGDPRAAHEAEQRRASSDRSSNNIWGTLSLG